MPTGGITVPCPVLGRSDERELYEYLRQIGVVVQALTLNAQPRIIASGTGDINSGDPDITVDLSRSDGEQLCPIVTGWSNGAAVVVGPPGSDLETRLQSTGSDSLTYTLTVHNASASVISYEYVVLGVPTAFVAQEQETNEDPVPFVSGGDGLAVTAATAQADSVVVSTSPAIIDVYTTGTSTWVKATTQTPKTIEVICVGCGGGGGGGKTGGGIWGGSGGGGGSVRRAVYQASDIGATESVVVGAAGAAGAAGNPGSAGASGGTAAFGSWLTAYGGGGGGTNGDPSGAGASAVASAVADVGGAPASTSANALDIQGADGSATDGYSSVWGGASGGSTAAGIGKNGGSSIYAAPGGGAGGSTASHGGEGGATGSYTAGGGGAYGLTGLPGSAGSPRGTAGVGPYCGTGGGGGGAHATAAGAGGAGGYPGAGGGGGGGSATASANGADGGAGMVIVVQYF